MDGAAFAVADQDVGAAELGEELPGDVAGVRAGVELGEVLAAVDNLELVALDEGLDAPEIRERREDGHLGAAVVVLGVGQGPGQLLQEGDALDMVHVHLPVACDEGRAVEFAVG